MNLRSLVALAALVAMPLTACVITPSTPRSPGNVTFLWTFNGQTCAQVRAIANVKITIPGQALQNDGVYPCSSNGTAGIVLNDFNGGLYSYTIQGRDPNGTVLYTKSGSFVIDGSVTETVNLDQVGNGSAYAYLVWTFPPNAASQNPNCGQAGVDKVLVSIDGADWIAYPCADGNTAEGTPTPYLSPGSHTIDLSAVNAQNYEYYSLRSTLPLSSTPTNQQYDLNWAVGGATVRWTVTTGPGGTTTTCGAAGIADVYVNFQDVQGNLVYGSTGDPQPCNSAGVVYSFLKPGTYRVFLGARGSGTSVYESTRTNAPSVTVVAGSFTTMSDGPNVLLNRVQ